MRQPRLLVSSLLLCLALPTVAQQDTLSLQEAVQLAKQRNGTVRAADLNVRAAKSRVSQAYADYFPTITPLYRFDDQRRDIQTGAGRGNAIKSTEHTAQIGLDWRILDAGQRNFNHLGSRKNLQAEEYSSINTLRQTLFDVYQQYFDTLRAQELQKIADAQVERAKTIVDSTEAQISVGAAPRKDILQARADYLNAIVQQLLAKNRLATNEAALKATIGLDQTQGLPQLEVVQEPAEFAVAESLPQLETEGIDNRADLLAQRKRIEAQGYSLRRLELEAGPTWALDGTFTKSFAPDVQQFRGLTFSVSMPLFDAGRSREAVREQRFGIEANRASLTQSERVARSEIESVYLTLTQNAERVKAAKLALEAARLNYQAAFESQQMGAEGTDVVTVLTALVSLRTAESNYIEAVYDYYIAEARLRLVTGRPIPGE